MGVWPTAGAGDLAGRSHGRASPLHKSVCVASGSTGIKTASCLTGDRPQAKEKEAPGGASFIVS